MVEVVYYDTCSIFDYRRYNCSMPAQAAGQGSRPWILASLCKA